MSTRAARGTLTERPEDLPRFAEVFDANLPGTIAHGYIDTPMTRDNRFPMPFLMPAERFARRAVRTIERRRSYRVTPWQMGLAAKLLHLLPNAVFDALFARAPQKARKAAA